MAGPEQQWRDYLNEGRLMLPRERESGRCFFPPRTGAPGSGGEWDWVEASGRGTIYSVSTISPRPPQPAYAVVLVDLAEGPRLMSQVAGIKPQEVAIGMAVEARIDRAGGEPLLLFVPAGHSNAPDPRS